MKKYFNLVLLLVVLLIFPNNLSALTDIKPYVNCTLAWKWYDGNDKWNSEIESPVGCEVDAELVEGIDYVREYAFTNNRNYSPDENSLEWKNTALGMSGAGYIWERVRGIGEYVSEDAARHEIYTAIFIYAEDKSKFEGEDDPKFTYKVIMHNDNPNNITEYFDITFKREEGEKPGEYLITPIISKKENIPDNELIYSGSMAIGDTTGRVYFYPKTGKLTINENIKSNVIVHYIGETGRKLIDDIILTGNLNDSYETEEKQFDDYELYEVKGNKTGVFEKEDIEIYYIYKKIYNEEINDKEIQEVVNVIDPPQTGFELKDYILQLIIIPISLMVLIISIKLIIKKESK